MIRSISFLLIGVLASTFSECGSKRINLPHQPSTHAVPNNAHVLYNLSKPAQVWNLPQSLKAFEFIDKGLMPQPEGICFSPKGDLYISTEGKHGKPAKVLKFQALK